MESESLSVFNNEDTFSANSERLITFDYVTFDREQILKAPNARQVHHG